MSEEAKKNKGEFVIERRRLVKKMVTGAAAVSASTVSLKATSQAEGMALEGAQESAFNSLYESIKNGIGLDNDAISYSMESIGVESPELLFKHYVERYPTFSFEEIRNYDSWVRGLTYDPELPEPVPFDLKNIKIILENLKKQEAKDPYEKGPDFDKEPYDKAPEYDKGGFSRTF